MFSKDRMSTVIGSGRIDPVVGFMIAARDGTL
jgi:hypothetical protein